MPWTWPFRRHTPEDAPAVAEAREQRDAAFVELDHAIEEVDRVHDAVVDAIVADYEAAEENHIGRGNP